MLSLSKKALVVVIGVFALTQTCAIADSRRDALRAIRDSELEEEYPMRLVMEGQDQPKYDDELEAWLEANDDDDDDDMADDDLDEGEDEDMGDDEHDLAMERDWGWLKNIGNHINRAVQRVSNHVHKAVQHVGNHIRTTIDRINNRHNPQPAPAPVPAPVPTPAPTTRAPTVAPTQAPTEPPVIEETTMPVVPEDVPSIGEDALPPQEETTTIGENALPPQEETPSIGENALPPQESGLLGERTFEMCPSHRIQLQASNGNLLARCEGCGSGSFANSITAPSALIADESAKTWRVRMLEDDRIALESEQGGYLGSLAEGAPYPWYVYSVGGNTVYLVSPHGKLLTRWGSDGTASMLHATTKTDAHVHWHVICMPAQEAVAGETAPEPETVAEPEPASEPRPDMQMPIKAPMLQPTGGRLV